MLDLIEDEMLRMAAEISAIMYGMDANEDGKTWAWINNAAGSDQLDKNADDWIITPPIELGTDYLYKLSFKTKGYGEFYTESFSTAFGSENTVEGMLNALGDYTVSGDTYLEKSSVIDRKQALTTSASTTPAKVCICFT